MRWTIAGILITTPNYQGTAASAAASANPDLILTIKGERIGTLSPLAAQDL